MSLARSRTQTVPFGDGRTNHDTTEAGRANLLDYSFQKEKVKHAYLENCRDVVDFVLMYAKLLIISGIFSQDTFFFSVPEHQ